MSSFIIQIKLNDAIFVVAFPDNHYWGRFIKKSIYVTLKRPSKKKYKKIEEKNPKGGMRGQH